jgi:hypothetical protein
MPAWLVFGNGFATVGVVAMARLRWRIAALKPRR